jgi:cyanophycin synthetase
MNILMNNLIIYFSLFLIVIYFYCFHFKTIEGMKVISKNMQKNVYDKYGVQIDKENQCLIYKGKRVSFYNNFNQQEGIDKSNDKLKTNDILSNYGFPVCNYIKYDTNKNEESNIIDINDKLKFPLVVKYNYGEKGNDVFTDIIDNDSLRDKLKKLLSENKNSIIIEEQTQGKKFRIMILNDKFVYADEDQKPVLTGNGQSTIQELISNYHTIHDVKPIKLVNEELINQQGYELTEILEKGKKLEITNVVSVANGGKQVYIEEYDIHPVNMNMFYQLNKILGLNFSGIDYMGPDLSIPYHDGGKVIEVNPFPGFSKKEQEHESIPKRLIDAIFG